MDKCKCCRDTMKPDDNIVLCEACEKVVHKHCAIKEGDKFYCIYCHGSIVFVGNEHEIIDMPVLPEVIRRSYIDNYKTCPFMAYNIIIKNLDLPSSSFAQVGIDLHEMFYEANIGELRTKEEMVEKYIKIFSAYDDQLFEIDLNLFKDKSLIEHKKEMWHKSLTCIDNYWSSKPSFPNRPFIAEETIIFSLREDLPKVSITMDRIDQHDEKLYITDYKTGQVKTGVQFEKDLQAPLYIYAVQQQYKKVVEEFRLFYIESGKERIYKRVSDTIYVVVVGKRSYRIDIQQTIKDVIGMFESMKAGKWNIPTDNRSMFYACKVCKVKAFGACNGAEIQLWKTNDID